MVSDFTFHIYTVVRAPALGADLLCDKTLIGHFLQEYYIYDVQYDKYDKKGHKSCVQNAKHDSLLKETSDIMLTKGKGGKGKIRGWEAIDNIRKGEKDG